MKYTAINSKLFEENRRRFVAQMKPNSIAIFHANDEMPRSADGNHHFRQNSDLFYLTGIDQEDTILVLFPGCPREGFEEVLFVRRTSDIIKVWEGPKLDKKQAEAASGIKKVVWTESFDSLLPDLMNLAENCYLSLNEISKGRSPVPDKSMRFVHEIQQSYPLHRYRRAAPIVHALRTVKSDMELELMKEAVEITNKAFRRVLKFTKPGVYEYEIEAEILHEFLINRATGPAYHSIIASNINSCVLHYVTNNRQCEDGDILLMDFGAEYANYAADLSRTIPINGRYSKRQADVYSAVLRVMKQSINMLRPGTLLGEYHKEVGKIVESELLGLGLLTQKDIDEQTEAKPAYKKYMMHGVSHFLGLDVHDVGNRYRPIEAGMVFTCEPGIYIPKENLGIRIENDILVTENGPVDLMANTPVEIEEIEDLMNG